MSHFRFFTVCIASLGLGFITAGGCASPTRNTSGTAGSGSPGSAGNGTPGIGGTTGSGGDGTQGAAGNGSPGSGGQGNEIIISGSAGMGGTTGSAGNGSAGNGSAGNGSPGSAGTGTPGAAGNGSGGSGGNGAAGTTGSGGTGTKMACPSATQDPLAYTSGYTADATIRSMAMSMATMMSDTEKQQQMSGLPQSGTANYNVFKQEDNTTRGIRGFYFRDGPRGVNLNANSDN